MWFWFAVIALLCWSGSDLFSKIGCQRCEAISTAISKMVTAVGVVMGLHAAYEIFVGGVAIDIARHPDVPAGFGCSYIASMAVGYVGLQLYRAFDLVARSATAPGAIVAVLTLITVGVGDEVPPLGACRCGARVHRRYRAWLYRGQRGRGASRAQGRTRSNRHYAKSWIAIMLSR